MKKINFLFYTILILIVSFSLNYCGSRDDNNNSCSNVSGFSVVQNGGFLNFTISSNESGTYEIAYGLTGNGSPQQTLIVNDKTFSYSINNFNHTILEAGKSYTFKIRRICSSSSSSDWGFEKSFTINNNFCKKPINFKLTNSIYNQISWSIDTYNNGNNPSYYQLQYGNQGFSLGSGTTIDTNLNYYNAPLVAGKKYDFYVRSFCSGTSGWGDWEGPLTVLSSVSTACVAPTYANYSVSSIDLSYFRAALTWENDGNSQYQVSLSSSSSVPNSSSLTIINAPNGANFSYLSKGMNYYFYVRKVCPGNTFSPYFGPYLVKWN